MEYEPLIYFYKYTQNKLQNSPPCETPVHSNCSESQTRGLWSLFTENSLVRHDQSEFNGHLSLSGPFPSRHMEPVPSELHVRPEQAELSVYPAL